MAASKKAKAPKPTATELDLLRTLWQIGPATVKQVHTSKQKETPELTYATVLRLMQVMHGKGLLVRDESERSHVYSPAQEQAAMQTHFLKDLISKVFAGSGKDLVLAALREGHVSEAEQKEIEQFLRENRHD